MCREDIITWRLSCGFLNIHFLFTPQCVSAVRATRHLYLMRLDGAGRWPHGHIARRRSHSLIRNAVPSQTKRRVAHLFRSGWQSQKIAEEFFVYILTLSQLHRLETVGSSGKLVMNDALRKGRAIAQAVSRRLPTAADRVRSCWICGGQSGTGAVLWFPLPIRIPPTAPNSPSRIICVVPSGLSLTP
jgi:hypothetical protein